MLLIISHTIGTFLRGSSNNKKKTAVYFKRNEKLKYGCLTQIIIS